MDPKTESIILRLIPSPPKNKAINKWDLGFFDLKMGPKWNYQWLVELVTSFSASLKLLSQWQCSEAEVRRIASEITFNEEIVLSLSKCNENNNNNNINKDIRVLTLLLQNKVALI